MAGEYFWMEVSNSTPSLAPQLYTPKPLSKPEDIPPEPVEHFEAGPSLGERLGSLKVFARPALAAASGVAIGAGVTALAAGGAATALTLAAPAILLGAAAGVAIGVVGMPREHGYLAGLGKFFSGGIGGLAGAAGGLVGKAGVLGLAAGGAVGSTLAVAGSAVIGTVAVGWALSKMADLFRFR